MRRETRHVRRELHQYPCALQVAGLKYQNGPILPTRKVRKMHTCELYKTAETEGKEKHVPELEIMKGSGKDGKDVVRITVGKDVSHPNTVEHHIAWAQLVGVKGNGMVIDLGKVNFAPAYTEPSADFHVKLDDFKSLVATSYCNIHGLWESSVDL